MHGEPVGAAYSGQIALDVNLGHSEEPRFVALCRPPLVVGAEVKRLREGVNRSAVLSGAVDAAVRTDREGA